MSQGKYAEIRADPQLSRPIAGGATHSHPEQEEQMHRDFDRRVYATLEELQAFDAYTSRLNAEALAAMRAELSGGGGTAVVPDRSAEEPARSTEDLEDELVAQWQERHRAAADGGVYNVAASAASSSAEAERIKWKKAKKQRVGRGGVAHACGHLGDPHQMSVSTAGSDGEQTRTPHPP